MKSSPLLLYLPSVQFAQLKALSQIQITLFRPLTEAAAPQVFAGYTESYITKEAAEQLQAKLKRMNRPVTEEEYNEMLQKVVMRSDSDPKLAIYNKKYYDYLPAESSDVIDVEQMQAEQKVSALDDDADDDDEDSVDFEPLLLDGVEEADEKEEWAKDERNSRSRRSVNAQRADDDDRHGISKRQTGEVAKIEHNVKKPTVIVIKDAITEKVHLYSYRYRPLLWLLHELRLLRAYLSESIAT